MSEPQVGAVTVGYVAASRTPSLATPSLADSVGDAVDAAALEFLVWAALKTPEQIERSKQASWRKQRKEAAKREKSMVAPLVSGSHLFACLACCLSSTVDTCLTSVYGGFLVITS